MRLDFNLGSKLNTHVFDTGFVRNFFQKMAASD